MASFLDPVKLFRQSVKSVSAYARFVKSSKLKPETIRTIKDFSKVPIMDKINYLSKSSLHDLFPEGHLPSLAYASSGSSGKPSKWFRSQVQDDIGGKLHADLLEQVFLIKRTEPTLIIVTFSMGVWVAGNYTANAFRYTAEQAGFNLSVVTPGIDKQDIIWALRELAPHFKRVIIAGYPPFLSDILHEARDRGIALPKRLQILTAGDTFSESWRTTILKFIGSKRPADVINIYGSADTGMLGFETPLSIYLRRLADQNYKIFKLLFPNAGVNPPAFMQYDPRYVYIEQEGPELLLTVPTASPLIRYNIHDLGTITTTKELKNLLKSQGLLSKSLEKMLQQWPQPFIIKYGRTDVAVTFYALNIYPEHFRFGLEHSFVAPKVTGNFFSYTKDIGKRKKQKLYLHIELSGNKLNVKDLEKIKQTIIDRLLEVNIEFRKLFNTIGNQAIPTIIFNSKNHKRFNLAHGLVTVNGKKPKIINLDDR